MQTHKKRRESPLFGKDTTFNKIKCATRKWTVSYLVGYFIVINILHLGVGDMERIVGPNNSFTRELFILSSISLVILVGFFLINLDSLQKELTKSIKILVDKVRTLSPENPGEILSIQTLSCDDELHTVVDAINRKSLQIQEYIDHLNQCIGYLSHEIHTPLSVIQLCVERLKKHTQHSDIQLIEDEIQQINKMSQMISILISGDSGESPTCFLLDAIVSKVVEQYSQLYPSHTISYQQPHEPIAIESYETYWHTIIRNILDNAIIHGSGSVTVTLEKNQLIVSDQGPGIESELLEKIWMPFRKKDTARSTAGSFGLGLALVRQLCTQVGASITVTSKPGETNFIITFS